MENIVQNTQLKYSPTVDTKNSVLLSIFEYPHDASISTADKEALLIECIKDNGLFDLIDNTVREAVENMRLYELRDYDIYTFYHSIYVGLFAAICAKGMNFNEKQIREVLLAGLFHDIGKMFIPKDILNKPGIFTDEERKIMNKHSQMGYKLMRKRFPELPEAITTAILEHHEKCDGSGYPLGLKRKEICVYAQILAVVDIYDALISNRCYRKAFTPSEGIKYLCENVSALDHSIISVFVQNIYIFPVGTIVVLSNKRKGIVIGHNPGHNLQPLIKMFDKDEVIDLKIKKNICIVQIIEE